MLTARRAKSRLLPGCRARGLPPKRPVDHQIYVPARLRTSLLINLDSTVRLQHTTLEALGSSLNFSTLYVEAGLFQIRFAPKTDRCNSPSGLPSMAHIRGARVRRRGTAAQSIWHYLNSTACVRCEAAQTAASRIHGSPNFRLRQT
ncbi:uncharacterized protein LOC113146921 [Cyclospora cayetanensis]|uniref:Uncharacterized protein LOC113146921 n=1 Tax=Cyclospora cayetanensis TaxID=88456 RepID=A0A6P6RUJ0_9EIME|nr:uncharacterized protein LOC113146921 [Cyclospora cayetanensis]